MSINWRFVMTWSLILLGMVGFAALLLAFSYGDRATLRQAAHDLGYNTAELLLGGLLPRP